MITPASPKQIELNFEAGMMDQFPAFMECVKASVYSCGKPFKAIAADMDMSSSRLSRMLNEHDEGINFPLHRLPDLIAATGDKRPLYWLVEAFLQDPAARKKQAMEELAAILPQLQKLVQAACDDKLRVVK